jgi:F0F1-type ATP synthase assembly protein I
MKKSKWPDFIVTLALRFIGGMILGCGLGVFLTYRFMLRKR